MTSLTLALLLAACSGSSGGGADSGPNLADSGSKVFDANVPLSDATPIDDASVFVDDASVFVDDASVSVDDASVFVDDASVFVDDASVYPDAAPVQDAGSALDPVLLCLTACGAFSVCFDEPVGGCPSDCTDDLQDCSASQLGEVAACTAADPGPLCQNLESCLENTACVDG